MLLGTIVAIPYMPASGWRAGSGQGSVLRSPLRRMAFHYWLAPLLVLGSFVHAWIPMASRHVPRTNFNGLWLATFALGLSWCNSSWALRYAPRGTARRIFFAGRISR